MENIWTIFNSKLFYEKLIRMWEEKQMLQYMKYIGIQLNYTTGIQLKFILHKEDHNIEYI